MYWLRLSYKCNSNTNILFYQIRINMNVKKTIHFAIFFFLLIGLVGSWTYVGYERGYNSGYDDGAQDWRESSIEIPPLETWNENYLNNFIYANYSYYFQGLPIFNISVGYGTDFTRLSIDLNETNIEYTADLCNVSSEYLISLWVDRDFEHEQNIHNGTSMYVYFVDDVNVKYYSYYFDGPLWLFTEDEGDEYFKLYYSEDGLLLQARMFFYLGALQIKLTGFSYDLII